MILKFKILNAKYLVSNNHVPIFQSINMNRTIPTSKLFRILFACETYTNNSHIRKICNFT